MELREIKCIEDQLHTLLNPFNLWLKDNEEIKHGMVGLLSLLSDGVFIYMIVDWARN
jgi:hypothetical protein